MDFMRAATFPFDDDEWLTKLGIAILVGLIPIVGAIVLYGWSLEISQRVKANRMDLLPGWENFGEYLRKGFTVFIAGLIYQLPTVIFVCIMLATSFLPALGGSNSDAVGALAAGMGFLAICLSCLLFLYSIAAGIVFFGGYVRYIERPELNTFFQFGENLALVRNNLGDFGTVILYVLLAGLVSSLVSATVIGGVLVTPFMMYFMGHLLGQLSRKLSGSEPEFSAPPSF